MVQMYLIIKKNKKKEKKNILASRVCLIHEYW